MRARGQFWSRAVQVLIAVLAAVLVTGAVGPQPLAIGYLSGGDPALVSQVRALVSGREARDAGADQGFKSLAVGVVDAGIATYAFVGDRGDGSAPDQNTTFELASITKTFTGHLLADAVTRGEVKLGDRISLYLPELRGAKVDVVTLEELATHRSGLPAYADQLSGATYEGFGSIDVQAEDESDVLRQTRSLDLDGRGTWQYSNLGVSLLGFALARAAHEPSWESLVHHRILDPLGMTATTFARTDADIPVSAALGHRSNGRVVEPVTGGGYLPAGTTTFTTVRDMTVYGKALLAGEVPGMWAMTPRYDIGADQWVGIVWYTEAVNGNDVQFHIGGVPGFSSVMIVSQRAGRAVIVLGGSEESVDAIGFHLLDPSSPVAWFGQSPVSSAVSFLGLLAVALSVLVGLRATRPLALMAAGLLAQGGLLVLLRRGPWHQLPAWSWGLVAAVVFWLTMENAGAWARLKPSRRDRIAGMVGLGVGIAAYGVAIWLG